MSGPSPNPQALEELWKQRLTDAKLRLDFARNFVCELVHDLPLLEISNADGHFAYQRAIRAETAALREYARVLRIHHDLTVDGVIPDESAWRSRAAHANESDEESR